MQIFFCPTSKSLGHRQVRCQLWVWNVNFSEEIAELKYSMLDGQMDDLYNDLKCPQRLPAPTSGAPPAGPRFLSHANGSSRLNRRFWAILKGIGWLYFAILTPKKDMRVQHANDKHHNETDHKHGIAIYGEVCWKLLSFLDFPSM